MIVWRNAKLTLVCDHCHKPLGRRGDTEARHHLHEECAMAWKPTERAPEGALRGVEP